jgi:hypothetical protein
MNRGTTQVKDFLEPWERSQGIHMNRAKVDGAPEWRWTESWSSGVNWNRKEVVDSY